MRDMFFERLIVTILKDWIIYYKFYNDMSKYNILPILPTLDVNIK